MIPAFIELPIIMSVMALGAAYIVHMGNLERRGLLRHKSGLLHIIDPRPRRDGAD